VSTQSRWLARAAVGTGERRARVVGMSRLGVDMGTCHGRSKDGGQSCGDVGTRLDGTSVGNSMKQRGRTRRPGVLAQCSSAWALGEVAGGPSQKCSWGGTFKCSKLEITKHSLPFAKNSLNFSWL
jgi:hypothetical protein